MSEEVANRPLALVCDDEELILDLLEHHLSIEGFEVATAANGQEALDQLHHRIPDVVVLDVMMPCIQGDEVLRRIREKPAWRHIPVLMLTFRYHETDVVHAFEVGASDYLAKPFTSAELMARIKRLVRPADRGPQTEEAQAADPPLLRPALQA
ncbi:MAG TPA: response regulator [Allosphingosinicella sp.]|jgi:DNA-binding response OmpR family regulator